MLLLFLPLLPSTAAAMASQAQHIYMAVDPLSGLLFAGERQGDAQNACITRPSSSSVTAGHYRAPRGLTAFQRRGTALASLGTVTAAGTGEHCRPMTVVPPGPGRRVSHLVVGTYKAAVLQAGGEGGGGGGGGCAQLPSTFPPSLQVLALPEMRLVHTHALQGMQVIM